MKVTRPTFSNVEPEVAAIMAYACHPVRKLASTLEAILSVLAGGCAPSSAEFERANCLSIVSVG